MCGIAASFAYSPQAPAIHLDEVRASLASMSRRGPDGTGIWSSENGRVALGHCRLAILDLTINGAQPMVSPKGDIRISFNGEIYNFKQLRQKLERVGYAFRTGTDTEVLLHLYLEKGQAMVDELEGMYALAIWDQRQNGLFLARDPYGIKPLYYADDGHTFRAASQVKALLAGGGLSTAPEPAGHVGFFLWGCVPEPFTLFKSIRSLPAGTSLWLDSSGRKVFRSFFSFNVSLKACQDGEPLTEEQRTKLIENSLRESVRKHLIADVPVGLFLSSGLDSACLLALATQEKKAIQTVTLGFEEYRGTPNDETVFAERLARHFGATHKTVWVSRKEFEEHSQQLTAAMDQPSIDGVNTYFVSYAAACASLKVAMSGVGGDELFGGYPGFKGVPKLVSSLKAFRKLKPFGRLLRTLAAPFAASVTSPKYAGLVEYGSTWGGAYLLRRGLFMPWELPRMLDRDFVNEGLGALQTVGQLETSVSGLRSSHAKMCALESQWYMGNQLLRDADWASMAHSLELRVPLVDSALFTRLSPLLSAERGLTKKDMAIALGNQLPGWILERPKTGFTIPVREWVCQKHLTTRSERGLRGWARLVYSNFAHASSIPKTCTVRNAPEALQATAVAA